jgi:hypothetical protein
MKALTQYGRQWMAEKHWREHCPKMVRALEAQGQLHAMLLEAEEKTKDEMIELTQQFRKQGLTAQQAHDRAWEMVREEYILLPPRPSVGHQPTATKQTVSRRISTAIASPTPTGWAKAVPKQKFSAKLKAIEILRALDAENRPASPDEKALLVKYVGWGAMPQVFDVDSTNWHKEQIQLSEILVRRGTPLRPRHHPQRPLHRPGPSSAPCIRPRSVLVFRADAFLEPACGIGHFIGLMPEAMLRKIRHHRH